MRIAVIALVLASLPAFRGQVSVPVPAVKPEVNLQVQPLPADLVAAWKKAGASVGWVGPDEWGALKFREAAEGKRGEVPAFVNYNTWKDGVVAQLPQPQTPFGRMSMSLFRFVS